MRCCFLLLVLTVMIATTGVTQPAETAEQAADKNETQIIVFNITSGPMEDTHAVTMALQLAGHALTDGREVVLFFNVRGVRVPNTDLPSDLAFKAEPISSLLADVMKRGAEVHVCPHCMHALDVKPEELIPDVIVTDREKLFSKIGNNTVVFTY